jgi:hypothetical protein
LHTFEKNDFMRNQLIIFSFTILFLAGCIFNGSKKIKGNGVIKTKKISLSQFNDINVNGAIHVFVKQDSVFSANIVADENLLEYVEVDATYRHVLNVNEKRGFRLSPSQPIRVYVTSPSIHIFDASGASSITSENLLNTDSLVYIKASGASNISLYISAGKTDADIAGASHLNLKGRSGELNITASGASNVKCFDLSSDKVLVDVAGASKAQVNFAVSLDAKASGASSILYKGEGQVSKNATGASSIEKAQ